MPTWPSAMQYLSTHSTEQDAREVAESHRTQEGFAAVRILPPSSGKPGWRVQAFYDVRPSDPFWPPPPGYPAEAPWLPDGCRAVILPPSVCRECGIPVPQEDR